MLPSYEKKQQFKLSTFPSKFDIIPKYIPNLNKINDKSRSGYQIPKSISPITRKVKSCLMFVT